MSAPLAERLRPSTFDTYIGQKHLIGEGAVLRKAIEKRASPCLSCGIFGSKEKQPWRHYFTKIKTTFLCFKCN